MVNEMQRPNIGKQLDIDFDQESFNVERKEVAAKYKVMDENKIFKDTNGIWRFIGNNQSVEEWNKDMNDLYNDNDNSTPYKH